MRIAFFADNFYPELSGIADTIIITGRELVKRGHDVVFIGPRFADGEYRMVGATRDFDGAQEVVHGMPALRLPSVPLPFSPTRQSRIGFPTGRSFSYLDRHKPDLVHTQSPYGTGFEALRAAKRYGVPVVGTNHTVIEEYYPFAPQAARRYEAWYYNHCALITTPFEALIGRMREVGFRKPAQKQSNPVILDLYAPPEPGQREAVRRALGLSGDVVLYAGRLAPEKRIDVLIRAHARLVRTRPQATLVIAGSGIERSKLEALARQLGIVGRVRFAGFLHPKELSEYYKAADAFAIMSTSDSQSLSLMQAHASALPSVGARSGGLPEYLPPETGFLVEPGDDAALAERLEALLSDPALRARLGEGGLRFVEQFSPERVADQWERIYADALRQRT